MNLDKRQKQKSDPKVSVVLPVFNGQLYLRDAIDSILSQSFRDVELIIINDGSTDNTKKIIESYHDSRITIVENEKKLGITKSLNSGIKLAKGEYVARMDADDISLPTRFEKQILFLEKNRQIGVCGTLTKTIGGKSNTIWKYPLDSDRIKASLLFHCCLVHSSVMIRAATLKNNNMYYDENYAFAQDYELWGRLSNVTKIQNLDEILIRYRKHSDSTGISHHEGQVKAADAIRRNRIMELVDSVTEEEVNLHNKSVRPNIFVDNYFLLNICKWFAKIYQENKKKNIYCDDIFREILAKRLRRIIRLARSCSPSTLRYIQATPFADQINLSPKQKMGLIWKVVKTRSGGKRYET